MARNEGHTHAATVVTLQHAGILSKSDAGEEKMVTQIYMIGMIFLIRGGVLKR